MKKYDDIYDAVKEMLRQPRSTWQEYLMTYIYKIEKDGLIITGNDGDELYYPDMNHFSEFYKGKFNIGDYVTHSIYGGYYRIVALEGLDIRNNTLNIIEEYTKPEYIWEYGDTYVFFGIDEKEQPSGSEIYMYGVHAGKDILFGECKERHLTLVPKNKIPQEIKNKVNKFVYQFNYLPEILNQLKETE